MMVDHVSSMSYREKGKAGPAHSEASLLGYSSWKEETLIRVSVGDRFVLAMLEGKNVSKVEFCNVNAALVQGSCLPFLLLAVRDNLGRSLACFLACCLDLV